MTKTQNALRFYCTENEWDCHGWCEGEHSRTKTSIQALRVREADIGPMLARDFGLTYTATLSTDGKALLVDVADPTGPNGQRSFIVEFTVREVT